MALSVWQWVSVAVSITFNLMLLTAPPSAASQAQLSKHKSSSSGAVAADSGYGTPSTVYPAPEVYGYGTGTTIPPPTTIPGGYPAVPSSWSDGGGGIGPGTGTETGTGTGTGPDTDGPTNGDGLPVGPTYGGSTPVYGTPIPVEYPGHGTCKFWSSNYGSWPSILSTISTISSVFGNAAGGYLNSVFGGGTTLMDALKNLSKDPYSSLVREATASLLNSYAYRQKFPFTPDVVKAKFAAALLSPSAAKTQSAEFSQANIAV